MNVSINEESVMTQHQTVGFSDQTQQWVYSVDTALDDAHTTTDTNDATLENFFKRPLRIATITWTVGGSFFQTLNPWQLFFENPRVLNRISNFHVLRSKLCVRIMINGNGFHYGRALASYRPLHGEDDVVAWRPVVPEDVVEASQRMHVWLDPTKSQGGTLVLPFIYYKNGMNIVEQDWRAMGELDLGSVAVLRHANGGDDAVTISVFAWAEDVSLSIPTLAEPGSLAPQGGEEVSMSSGPISGPAAVVSKVAGALARVPTIRPYALATQMASDAVGNVARAFGMSRPVDVGPVQSYKPTYTGNMVNANTLDTSTKLTYDVKQELTIDPRACGMGPADEMSLLSLTTRESYLTQFNWTTSAAPESLLWNSYVTPFLWKQTASGEVHFTPMAYTAFPFEFWRGSINFRFQIVASAFHKGRLKIVYDPYAAPGGGSEYNVQYTHVIDLAKERDFTVTINWGQELSFLRRPDEFLTPFSNTALLDPKHEVCNGVLYVYVVNDLTTPSLALDPVSVLVSVSSGDDFEVVSPTAMRLAGEPDPTPFVPQGGSRDAYKYLRDLQPQGVNADGDLTTEESAPIQDEVETALATKLDIADNTQKIYFADPVTSIRQVLKRYQTYLGIAQLAPVAGNETLAVIPDFPLYRGYAGGGGLFFASLPTDPTPYNYSSMTMMNWFTPCFLCRRGGIRYKAIFSDTTTNQYYGNLSVKRLAVPTGAFLALTNIAQSPGRWSYNSDQVRGRVLVGHEGALTTPITHNPVLEYELPMQRAYRFVPGRRLRNLSDNWFDQYHSITFPHSPTSEPGAGVTLLVSAAEDFSLSFYQSTPVMWFAFDPAASASM